VQDQLPSVTILSGTRLSLTLVGFDKMDFTAVADEHIYREDIEQIALFYVDKRKVKLSQIIHVSEHYAPIGLGSTVIDNIVARRSIEPSRLDLNFDQGVFHIEDQIVCQSVSNRLKNSPTTLQTLKNGCLFSNISLELCIHLLILRIEPDELPLLYPATYWLF